MKAIGRLGHVYFDIIFLSSTVYYAFDAIEVDVVGRSSSKNFSICCNTRNCSAHVYITEQLHRLNCCGGNKRSMSSLDIIINDLIGIIDN